MGKLIQFKPYVKKFSLSITEYGKILWNTLHNREPEVKKCPKCGYKLQWIRIEESPMVSYWGCMKCKLRTTTTIQECNVGYKLEYK